MIYVAFMFCFQAAFMEYPYFELKVFLLIAAAVANFLLPAALTALHLWGSLWRSFVSICSAMIAITAWRCMVVGPAPSSRCDGNLKGRVCIITGSNTGIGYETAEEFARRDATIVFACRNKEKASKAMQSVAAKVPGSLERLHFIELDVSSLQSVRDFVDAFKASGLELHVLVLNAGVLMSTRQLSKDGIEMTLAANVFGHFLLVQLLLPKLLEAERRGEKPRVVAVGSTFYFLRDRIDFDEIVAVKDEAEKQVFLKRPFTLPYGYGHSKLATNLLHGELARRLIRHGSKIPVNIVHPGECLTEAHRDMHPALVSLAELFRKPLRVLLKTPHLGCLCTVHVATAPELSTSDPSTGGTSGAFFMRMKPAPLSDAARDTAVAEKLWKVAVNLTGAPDHPSAVSAAKDT
jgi:NAD(P)-dependent dehydrogenase (short-subunit alcohol dehydrogenase family)